MDWSAVIVAIIAGVSTFAGGYILVVGLVAMRCFNVDFGSTCGMLCGSMANPMALNYANDTIPGEYASVSYATVYPLSMFARVIIAQLVLMLLM